MKKKKAGKLIFVIELVLGALLAIGVKLIFHGCRSMDGEAARCAGAENAILILGILMCAAALIGCIVKNDKLRSVASLIFAVLAILVIALPGTALPLCMMPDMRCLMVMRPATMVIGIVSAAVGILGFIYSIRKEGK